MKFLQNTNISTIGWLFVLALVVVGGLFASSSLVTIDRISDIKSTWDKFEESRSEKAAALSALRKEIGYGGMIHQFKNFVLRHDMERVGIVNAKLGGAASAIARYQALGLNDVEKKAIADIQETLAAYARALRLSTRLVARGVAAGDIDKQVRIDDNAAIAGLDTLDREVTKSSGADTLHFGKSQAVASLRKAMGYGGMIHRFKNFVLRHDSDSLDQTRRNIEAAHEAIRLYSERPLSEAERKSLTEIATVVSAYSIALNDVGRLYKEGKSSAAIDQVVQIDDSPALTGFEILTREISNQNAKEAIRVDESLKLVTSIAETTILAELIIISLLVAASLWLIRSRITGPIAQITGIMTRLAAGDFNLKVHARDQSNEIGEMARAVEIFRNTALEREKAEEEINQFKTTLDRTRDCIFMFRPDTLKFFYVNRGAMDQVKYSQQVLLNMTPFEIKPDYDEAAFRDMIQPLIDGPDRVVTFETRHETRTGELIPVEIFLQYIDPLGEEPRFVAIVRDISVRKEVERTKTEFISTVSHELRTPLTSIKGSLGLIRSEALGPIPEKAMSMLDIAYANSDRLNMLINDILDIEKIEAGKLEFNMMPTNVSTLVGNAIEANKGYADLHKATFEFVKSADQLLVQGDKDRLMQVLSNLMSNAAKFSPDGSTVELSVHREDNMVRVSVKDQGRGIPEEFRDKIFEKFTQADSSDTRQIGGTGLGLSISRSIIEQHGGKIGFESEVDAGSTFYFTLPVQD